MPCCGGMIHRSDGLAKDAARLLLTLFVRSDIDHPPSFCLDLFWGGGGATSKESSSGRTRKRPLLLLFWLLVCLLGLFTPHPQTAYYLDVIISRSHAP